MLSPKKPVPPLQSSPVPVPSLTQPPSYLLSLQFAFFWVVWDRNTGLGTGRKVSRPGFASRSARLTFDPSLAFFTWGSKAPSSFRGCAIFTEIVSLSFGTVAWSKCAESRAVLGAIVGRRAHNVLLSLAVPRASCRTRARCHLCELRVMTWHQCPYWYHRALWDHTR